MKAILLLLGAVAVASAAETTTDTKTATTTDDKAATTTDDKAATTSTTDSAYNDEFNDESHPDTPWTYLDHGKWWGTKSEKSVPGN